MTPELEQLQQTLIQLQRMYEALGHLRERTGGKGQFFVLSEGPLDEIRRLEETVADLTGRVAVEQNEADVWLQVEGPEIAWPEAPTSVLTYFLDAMRKGVTAATEWIVTGQLSTRPTKEVKSACDLRVVALQPGSVRVGVRLPDAEPSEEQTTLDFHESVETRPTPGSAAREALEKYLAVANWAGSGDPADALTHVVDTPELRRLLLTEVKRLVPRPRGNVQSVALYGRLMPSSDRVSLTRDVQQQIDSAIDQAEQDNIVERHAGDLREIDLDNLSFTLRNVGNGVFQVQCQFGHDLYDSALDALDRRVEVTGVRPVEVGRGHVGKLKVTRLVVLDDETEEQVVEEESS